MISLSKYRRSKRRDKNRGGGDTQSWSERIQGRPFRKGALIALAVIVFLMGGGSRYDIQSLVILRPLAILLGGYALIVAPREHVALLRVPLILLFALLSWTLLQFIPLPTSMWTMLPYREGYRDIAQIAGLPDVWRPLSVSPSRTLNTAFALLIPICALLVFAAVDMRDRSVVLTAIVVFALSSAAIGALQLLGSSHGPLYLYSITNYGLPVGLFANRNHQAVFLASAIPLTTAWLLGRVKTKSLAASLAFAAGLFFALMVLLTGSRAGFVAAGLAILFATVAGYTIHSVDGPLAGKTEIAQRRRWILIGAGMGLSAVALLVVGAIRSQRTLAIDRLLATGDELEDIRGEMLPVLIEMVRGYMPFGTGMGSFERAFYRFETPTIMHDTYLNHAHNDWAQIIIEGGLPVALIALAALLWLLRLSVSTVRRLGWNPKTAVFASLLFAIFIYVMASAVDYPLRTPAIMVVMAWLVALIVEPSTVYFSHRGKTRSSRR